MKLKCIIGSLSCDGVRTSKGDIFELGDIPGNLAVQNGYATEIKDADDSPVKEEPIESVKEEVIEIEESLDKTPVKTRRKKQ